MTSDKSLDILILQLLEEQQSNKRSLEEYLLTLWLLAHQYRYQTTIGVNQFLELLKSAFTVEAPLFKDEWRHQMLNKATSKENSFLVFEETILRQIVDLREMNEIGLLSNKMRYLGLDPPRGNRWFNFDPLTYLECATAGGFADLDKYNSISYKNADSDRISWSQINDFLWCGQIYE